MKMLQADRWPEAAQISGLLEAHAGLLWALTAVSVLTFVGTLLIIPILVARLPEDYFLRRPVRDWPTRHPAIHLLLVLAKNVFGLVLLAAGLAMLVLPGQGLLTIMVGLMMVDFPRKRSVERWLIRRPPVLRAANWMRARYRRPPLVLPGSRSGQRS